MNNNFIETLRINNLHIIPPYDEKQQDSCYISVGRIDNRYGILKEDGSEFLPFEYDNITVWGFGILQLSLNGKLGLLHIRHKDGESDFHIAKLIDCEYDVIEGEYQNVILLRKYGMPNELFNGRSVKAYLTVPEILTVEYADACIMSTEYKRGLLSLTGHSKEIIISTETGKVRWKMTDGYTLGGYNAKNATVLQQDIGWSSRLLYIEENKIKEHVFSGYTAYALAGINADGNPHSLGFIVETDDGFKILDDELNPLSHGTFERMTVHPEVTAYNHNGEATVFSLKKQNLHTRYPDIF